MLLFYQRAALLFDTKPLIDGNEVVDFKQYIGNYFCPLKRKCTSETWIHIQIRTTVGMFSFVFDLVVLRKIAGVYTGYVSSLGSAEASLLQVSDTLRPLQFSRIT